MNLKHHFLVAMPHIKDPLFARSVIYLFEHNNEGARGLILNKPIEKSKVWHLFKQFDFLLYRFHEIVEQPLYCGGPLNNMQGYILHATSEFDDSAIRLTDQLMLTRSEEILKTIGTPEQPTFLKVFLGYCGWHSFQLEDEIQNNDWLVVPASPEAILNFEFEPYEKQDDLWIQTAKLIHVDLHKLSNQIGRA